MKFLTILFGFGVILISVRPGTLHAQTAGQFDAARMQRDVEIMEMVLDRLLNQHSISMLRFGQNSARGAYLPEFGVLFQVPRPWHDLAFFEYSIRRDNGGKTRVEKRVNNQAYSAEGEAVIPEDENFRRDLIEFFANYADAIGQLQDNDRIAVFSEGGSELSVFFDLTGDETGQVATSAGRKDVLAWVRKAEVVALQSGRLRKEDFQKRVQFMLPGEDDSEIDIMAGILDRATASAHGRARGLYVESYGAVFFAQPDFAARVFAPGRERLGLIERMHRATSAGTGVAPQAIEDYLREAEQAQKEREQQWQLAYKKFKDSLAETIIEYGHTLRRVKPSEWIVITADLRHGLEAQPQQLICRVKKQSVDLYNERKLTREQLLKRISFSEY